jgi:hypothetical protein
MSFHKIFSRIDLNIYFFTKFDQQNGSVCRVSPWFNDLSGRGFVPATLPQGMPTGRYLFPLLGQDIRKYVRGLVS